MMYRRSIRERALKLRIQGKSYNEIYKELLIPKSTLRSWFSHTVLSDKARQRLSGRIKAGSRVLIRRNKMQTHIARQRMHDIRRTAAKRVPRLDKRDLLLSGALLYWAEGYKRPRLRDGNEITAHTISFVNADSDMIRIFISFLKLILGVEQKNIRATMRLYAHINEQHALSYWTSITGLPNEAFRKTTFLISGASKLQRPYNRLPYGTLQIEVQRTDKFNELMGLIQGVKDQIFMIL